MPDELTPTTNIEKFLAKTAGESVELPEPATRIEKYLNKIASEQTITEATDNWLDEHIDPSTGYVLDSTLTMNNAAPPASAVGDLKSALDEQSENVESLYTAGKNLIDPNELTEGLLDSTGAINEVSGYKTCQYIPIKSGDSITFSRIRKFMAYNSAKQIVSGSFVDSAIKNYTYTAVADGFVRASVADEYINSWQAEYGTSSTPYEEYKKFLAIGLGNTPLEQVSDLIAEKNAAYLFEDITPSSGYTDNVFIRWDTGGTSGNSSYRATPQISVVNYTHILYSRIQLSSDVQSNAGMAFVSKTEYVSGQQRVVGSALQYIPTLVPIPEGAVSARFTEHKSLTGFSIKGVRKIDVKDIAKNANILFGKKWVVAGDSFTAGATNTTIQSGKYAGYKYVYPYLIGNRNDMNIVSFFTGGRTLAFPAEPGEFTNSLTCPTADWYYQNIPADADFITIMLGINDGHHAPNSSGDDGEDTTGEIPIGTLDDATTATFGGAWNVVLTWLLTNRPNAHIGIIVSNGLDHIDYRTMTINAAKKYGLPYIDLNGDERCRAMIRSQNPDIPSAVKYLITQAQAVDPATNTHPNDAAHLLESTFIENFLRSI